MKGFLFLGVLIVVLSSASCKSRDRCGDCPTFSKVEKIEAKQTQY